MRKISTKKCNKIARAIDKAAEKEGALQIEVVLAIVRFLHDYDLDAVAVDLIQKMRGEQDGN